MSSSPQGLPTEMRADAFMESMRSGANRSIPAGRHETEAWNNGHIPPLLTFCPEMVLRKSSIHISVGLIELCFFFFFFKEACMKLCGQFGIFTCKAVNIIYLPPTPVFITADRIAETYGIWQSSLFSLPSDLKTLIVFYFIYYCSVLCFCVLRGYVSVSLILFLN